MPLLEEPVEQSRWRHHFHRTFPLLGLVELEILAWILGGGTLGQRTKDVWDMDILLGAILFWRQKGGLGLSFKVSGRF